MKPAEVAEDLGISRNAVYQHITSLKRAGVLDDTRRQAALDDDVFGSATHLLARAEARIAEITEQETQLKQEKAQLEAFVKRNKDLLPA
jgi:predicted transcriptional regulator